MPRHIVLIGTALQACAFDQLHDIAAMSQLHAERVASRRGQVHGMLLMLDVMDPYCARIARDLFCWIQINDPAALNFVATATHPRMQ